MEVILTPEAQKQYKKLPKIEQNKIKKKLIFLKKNPHEGKKLSGKWSTLRSLRAWPYRIIYFKNEKSEVIYIVTIAHRQGVYR